MQFSDRYFPRVTAWVILCVISSSLNYGCASSEDKLQKHYSKAMDYISRQEYEAAGIELKNVLQANPKHAKARYQLGLVYLKLKNPEEAFKQLEIAAELDPENTDAMLKSAEMLYLDKQYGQSRGKVVAVLARDADNVDALVLQASLEEAEGNHSSALKVIDKAIETEGGNDHLHVLRGRICLASGDLKEAERSFQKAMQLKEYRIETHLGLTELFIRQGKKGRAAEQMELMVSIMHDSPQAFLVRARFYQNNRDYSKALDSLKKAAQLEPENARNQVLLGDFYRRMRDYDNADAAYDAATNIAKDPAMILARQAELAFETGRVDKAKGKVKAALNADSRNLDAQMVNAQLKINDQELESALEILEQVLRDYPGGGRAYYLKALAYLAMGNNDLAVNAGLEAIKHEPDYVEAHTLLADLYLRKGDVTESRQEAVRALQLEPTNLSAAMILGRCLIAEKDYDKAMKLFSEIREKAPDNPAALHAIGLVYLAQGKNGQAVEAFKKALELAPGAMTVLKSLVALHIKNGDQKKALEAVEQRAGKFSGNAEYHVLKGRLYEMSNGIDQAEKDYRMAITLDPQTPEPYMFLAAILVKEGKTEDAVQEYKAVLKQNPNLAEARMQLATLFEAGGNYRGAAEQYEEILAINPTFVPAANNLAWYLAEHTEDIGEALRLALVASSGAPDDPNVADTVGWIHYKRGSHDLALSRFRQAAQVLSDNPTILYHLALAQVASGKKDAAIGTLTKALALKKEFPEAPQAAAKLDEMQ